MSTKKQDQARARKLALMFIVADLEYALGLDEKPMVVVKREALVELMRRLRLLAGK